MKEGDVIDVHYHKKDSASASSLSDGEGTPKGRVIVKEIDSTPTKKGKYKVVLYRHKSYRTAT